jgi:hypothetical protein
MTPVFKKLLLATLIAGAGAVAFAQGTCPMGGQCDMMGGGRSESMGCMGAMDPAKMQEMMDKRTAALKAKLKITPAQEGAWTTFTGTMKPPAGMMGMKTDRAELEKLPTPERIDKMRAQREQHHAEMTSAMDKAGEAAKALYAQLTPEQKKVFDAEPMSMSMGGKHHGRPQGEKRGPQSQQGAPKQ